MHHAVAVEGVVELQRRMQRVLGVAQVHTVEVAWDLTLDDGQVVGVPLGGLRAPRAGPVGWSSSSGRVDRILADDLDICRPSHTPLTMKLTVVAVLPPKLSVPNVFAPSTW